MKRKNLVMAMLVGVIFLSGCEKSVDPGVSENELIQQTLDRIEKNEGISYKMFGILGERMTSDSLNLLEKNATTKASFINVVARQTDDYFHEVVEGWISEFDITTIPSPYSGEAEITLKNLAATPDVPGAAPFNLVSAYSKSLLKQIDEQAGGDHKEWIIIESIGMAGTASDSKPSETISLNYEEIKMMATVPPAIIMDLSLTDEQVLTTINDVLNSHEIPPVAIGLLLPAVQKIREANSSNDQPFSDAMNTWLDGPIAQALNGNLDRDIIRRIQAANYLAALLTITLDEYQGTNADMASLSVLHARYRASLIVATEELYGN